MEEATRAAACSSFCVGIFTFDLKLENQLDGKQVQDTV